MVFETVCDFLTSGFFVTRMMPVEEQLRILMMFQIVLGIFDYVSDILVAARYVTSDDDRIYGILMFGSILFCAVVSVLTAFSFKNIHPLVFLLCATGIGGEFQGLYILLFRGFGNRWHELNGSQYMIFRQLEEIEFSLESVLGALVQLHALMNMEKTEDILDPFLLGSLALSLISMVLGLVMQKNFHCKNLMRLNMRQYLAAYFLLNYIGNGIAISMIFSAFVAIEVKYVFISVFSLVGFLYLYWFKAKRSWSRMIQGALNSIAVNSEVWDLFYIGNNLEWPQIEFYVLIMGRICLNVITVGIGLAFEFKLRNLILACCVYILEIWLAWTVFLLSFKDFKACYLVKAYVDINNFAQTGQVNKEEITSVKNFIEGMSSPAVAIMRLKLSVKKIHRNRSNII